MMLTVHSILTAAPTLEIQVIISILHSLLWYIVTNYVSQLFRGYIKGKSWRKRWVNLSRRTMERSFFISLRTEEEYEILATEIIGEDEKEGEKGGWSKAKRW